MINGQKAIVNIIDIKPFFNIIIPKEILLPIFKIKLVKILSNILESVLKFRIKTINTFLLQRYHTEKKLYIYIKI